jgi:hypothetical protein
VHRRPGQQDQARRIARRRDALDLTTFDGALQQQVGVAGNLTLLLVQLEAELRAEHHAEVTAVREREEDIASPERLEL